MRKLLTIILFCGIVIGAEAQSTTDAIKAGWGNLNYSVPEAPAFKILGTSPSDIMRPSSTRDIAISIGDHLFTNGASIPRNLAVEFSPAVFKPNISLADYQKKRLWNSSAFSVGTKVNSDKSYAIGLGFRIKLIDKADLRTDPNLVSAFNVFGAQVTAAYSKAANVIAANYLKDASFAPDLLTARGKVTTAYATETDPLHKEVKKAIDELINQSFDVDQISRLRDSIKKDNWNKIVWNLGTASLLNAKDSLLRSLQPVSKIGLWSTIGLPMGKKGQMLIGLTGQLRDTLKARLDVASLNIGARYYYGGNDLKGFIEGDAMVQSYQKGTYKAALGIETTFIGGMWVNFSLGLTKRGSEKAVFTPGINLAFANGEKKSNASR